MQFKITQTKLSDRIAYSDLAASIKIVGRGLEKFDGKSAEKEDDSKEVILYSFL
jgi:hypothetical protein